MFSAKSGMRIACGILFITALSFGRIAIKTTDPNVDLGITTAGWVQTGQMRGLFTNSADAQPLLWQQQEFLNFGIDAVINKRIKIAGALEGEMWQNMPKGGASSQSYYVWRYNSTFLVDKAYGEYLFGDVADPDLDVTVGRFPYKYNPDVRNLGEYLFRSGTYPAYLINNFDEPFARLTGFKFSKDLFEKSLHQDLIISFSTDLPPYGDASISYIGDYRLNKAFDIGWGAQFANLISVDENMTTPQNSSRKTDIQYVKNGDTGYYTFRGIKLMGRFCFDPKPLLGQGNFNLFGCDLNFGKEDCKLYGEAAILGVESYPANDTQAGASGSTTGKNFWGYDKLDQKIPVTLGFNFPAFKLLDVLGAEVEWYGCKYANNLDNVVGQGSSPSLPIPFHDQRNPYDADHWKWTVYAKKMFANDHFGFIVQFARDHSRLQSLQDDMAFWELEEAQNLPGQWYWMTKLVAQF